MDGRYEKVLEECERCKEKRYCVIHYKPQHKFICTSCEKWINRAAMLSGRDCAHIYSCDRISCKDCDILVEKSLDTNSIPMKSLIMADSHSLEQTNKMRQESERYKDELIKQGIYEKVVSQYIGPWSDYL